MEFRLPQNTMRHTRSSALRYQNGSRRSASKFSVPGGGLSQTAPIPNNATVLSLNEFGHIVSKADRSQSIGARAHILHDQAKRAELRKRSEARYRNWGNTLEALREKKKSNRVKRMEEVEARQQIIDDQEAAYQDAQRRAVIERANQIMYTQNDRVKMFQTGLLYSNVLKAREAQVRMSKKKKQRARAKEEEWHKMEMKQLAGAVEKEKKELLAAKQKAKDLAMMQLTQLAVKRQRNMNQRMEEIAEGERIKQAAADAVVEAKEAELARLELRREQNRQYKLANEEQRRLKAEQARLDQLEEDQLMAFAKEKERLAEDRKRIVGEQKRAKEQRHEMMLQRQYEYLQNIKNVEEARLEKSQAELEAKTDMFLARRAAQKEANLKETHKSRQQQIRERKRAIEKQQEEERIIVQHWEKRRKEMDQLQEANDRKQEQNNRALKSYLKEQMRAKAELAKQKKMEEYQEAQYYKDLQRREDAVFNEYTRAHMIDYANRDQTVKPMQILLVKEQVRHIRGFDQFKPSAKSKPAVQAEV